MVGFASIGVTCTLEAIMTIFRQIFRDQFLVGNCREKAPTIYRLLFRSHTQKKIDCRKTDCSEKSPSTFSENLPTKLVPQKLFWFPTNCRLCISRKQRENRFIGNFRDDPDKIHMLSEFYHKHVVTFPTKEVIGKFHRSGHCFLVVYQFQVSTLVRSSGEISNLWEIDATVRYVMI